MSAGNGGPENRAILTGVHAWPGNDAATEGALAAGCRFYSGYPITPQSEMVERMSERMPQVGGSFIQMEDEIASICACIGAALTGAKAMTGSSGPGIALKQEAVSWASSIEVPLVIYNAQRTGPGSGIVGLPHHGDIFQAKYGGNGDYPVIALAPATSQECFDLTIEAFNLAERWRTPTYVFSDSLLAHLVERVVVPPADELAKRVIPRRLPEGNPKAYVPFSYEIKGEITIPPLPRFGTPFFPDYMPSVTHNERGIPILDPVGADRLTRVLNDKVERNAEKIAITEAHHLEDCDILLVAYGLPYRTALRAMRQARSEGKKVGLLRLVSIWPFPWKRVEEACQGKKAVIVPEINYGQMVICVDRAAARAGTRAHLLPKIADLHTPDEILKKIGEVAK